MGGHFKFGFKKKIGHGKQTLSLQLIDHLFKVQNWNLAEQTMI